jgi:hypothetical protein
MISRTVYSLYYPETRAVVEDLWLGRHHEWYERAATKHQDAMHLPFLAAWREWCGLGLADAFPHAYPTSGASEPIKDLILPPGRLHVFDGEYEGYAAIAAARGMQVVTHERSADAARHVYDDGDQFWISNPSAIDGNVWTGFDAFVEEMRARNPGVRIFLDVTYVGATKTPVRLEPARHPNVAATIFSLSKPFGVYYHRIGGVVSREPIATLHGSLWFKNLLSLKIGETLMTRFGPTDLPRQYAYLQEHVLARAKAAGRAPASARTSEVVLLAHAGEGAVEFRRAPGRYRFCLQDGMERMLKGELR